MRRDGPEAPDGPEGPELPSGRRQPEKEETVAPWPTTPGELVLCIPLFILFFALSWGLVLWDEQQTKGAELSGQQLAATSQADHPNPKRNHFQKRLIPRADESTNAFGGNVQNVGKPRERQLR